MIAEYIPTLLWIIAIGVSVFVVLLGCVLAYHWIRFAMNTYATIIALSIYMLVSLVLLIAMFGVAATYSV
jgi:hypothetical protein